MNWRAVDLATWVLMVVVLAVGVGLFVQAPGGGRVWPCVLVILALSSLHHYAKSKSSDYSQAAPPTGA